MRRENGVGILLRNGDHGCLESVVLGHLSTSKKGLWSTSQLVDICCSGLNPEHVSRLGPVCLPQVRDRVLLWPLVFPLGRTLPEGEQEVPADLGRVSKEDDRVVAQDGSVKQVEILRNSNFLLDYYQIKWRTKFGEDCAVEEDDRVVASWLYQKYGLEKAKEFISRYLEWENDWVSEQGYPLRLLRKNINAVISNTGSKTVNKEVYVCGYTVSGRPVCSNKPEKIMDFTPVLWDEWVRSDITTKLQHPKKNWEASGSYVDSWIELWKEEGWAK